VNTSWSVEIDRSSDGSGSKNNSHTITLTRGVKAPTEKSICMAA
jgi:hypothetical protein